MRTDVVRLQSGLPLREVALVEASYARLQHRLVPLSIAFCERLLAMHPGLYRLFPTEDVEKREIAVSFLGFVVKNLRSTERLGQLLERMGARGLLNGLSSTGVDDVGRSLLATMRDLEGANWNADTERAWAVTCAWTAAALRRGVHR